MRHRGAETNGPDAHCVCCRCATCNRGAGTLPTNGVPSRRNLRSNRCLVACHLCRRLHGRLVDRGEQGSTGNPPAIKRQAAGCRPGPQGEPIGQWAGALAARSHPSAAAQRLTVAKLATNGSRRSSPLWTEAATHFTCDGLRCFVHCGNAGVQGARIRRFPVSACWRLLRACPLGPFVLLLPAFLLLSRLVGPPPTATLPHLYPEKASDSCNTATQVRCNGTTAHGRLQD